MSYEITFPEQPNPPPEEEKDICFSYPWPEIALSGVFGLLVGLLLASNERISEKMERGRLWLIALLAISLIVLVSLIVYKFNVLGQEYREYFGAGVVVIILAVLMLIGVGLYGLQSPRRDSDIETRRFTAPFRA